MAQNPSSDGLLRIVLIVVALVVLLPFLLMAFMLPMLGFMGGYGGMMGGWGGMMDGTGGYGIWGWGMMLLWFLVLAGVGYVVYRAISRTTPATTDPALKELRVQYARGELTDEEFEERRTRLTRNE